MKKITLSLPLILFLILIQTDILTAEVSKNEKDHHDHSQEDSGQHKDEAHGDHENNDKHSNQDNHKNHDDHADNTDHNEKDEHGDANHDDHEEEGEGEGSSGVGPDKGILEKSEQGFKLSPKAIKSFELKIQTVSNKGSEFPRATLVEIKDGKFVYRIRENWIKKVSVKVIKKNKDTVILELSQFQAGDKIIVGGTGFIRVSELVAEEGVSHGHSH